MEPITRINMVTKELTVLNRAGIHARPASEIAKTAQRFKSDVTLSLDTMAINAKSIMGVITLGAIYKTKLKCICDGPDENEAMNAIETLFDHRFESQ